MSIFFLDGVIELDSQAPSEYFRSFTAIMFVTYILLTFDGFFTSTVANPISKRALHFAGVLILIDRLNFLKKFLQVLILLIKLPQFNDMNDLDDMNSSISFLGLTSACRPFLFLSMSFLFHYFFLASFLIVLCNTVFYYCFVFLFQEIFYLQKQW